MPRRGEPMVGWYDPVQLLRTAVDIFVSEELNARADTRLLEIQSGPEPSYTEGGVSSSIHGAPERDFWFDYVADTGEGFIPTFAMAQLLSRPSVELADGTTLPRGAFLVLGGDAVYPVASREAYERRLKMPFELACEGQAPEPAPHIYAIPGNHDWYDELISFTRLFTGGSRGSRGDEGRRIGLWRTRQSRSYFSIRLPGGWWLWGSDIQLKGDVDEPQRAFFREMLRRIGRGDRIIACTPEPDWLYEDRSPNPDLPGRLELLSEGLSSKAATVPLQLSGDLHNYQRFDATDRPHFHKVVSGGGGAFLHPTHAFRERRNARYRRGKVYPASLTSFGLSFGCFLLPFLNPPFSLLTASIYVVFAWPLFRVGSAAEFFREGGTSLFLAALVVLACAFYAYPRKGFRWWGGIPHGLAQGFAAYLVCRAIVDAHSRPDALTWPWALAILTVALAGGLVMPVLLGAYLFLSLNLFGFHPNEAFTALRIQRHKHFLRCRIATDCSLTVFVVGLDNPRRPDAKPHLVDSFTIPAADETAGRDAS